MLSNLILLTCLNRYLLVLCYTIVTFSLNRLTASPYNKVCVILNVCTQKKSPTFVEPFCGADGTRTRDLRRDRPIF